MGRNLLLSSRTSAFYHQAGCCYYCGLPMWILDPESFARRHGLTLAQARRLQCTAEHLKARQDGGSDSRSNIVAACLHCNTRRHKHATGAKLAPEPDRYQARVRAKLSRGRWHGEWVLRLLAGAPALCTAAPTASRPGSGPARQQA